MIRNNKKVTQSQTAPHGATNQINKSHQKRSALECKVILKEETTVPYSLANGQI